MRKVEVIVKGGEEKEALSGLLRGSLETAYAPHYDNGIIEVLSCLSINELKKLAQKVHGEIYRRLG